MKSGKLIPLMFGASALLIASSMFLMMDIADRTVAVNAERTSMAWVEYGRLVNEPGRIKPLCNQPWIRKVRS